VLELATNLNTAKAMGATVPEALLGHADKVIERDNAICCAARVCTWPISEVAARLIEVRSVGRSGLDLLTLSSSHFDPEQKSSLRRYADATAILTTARKMLSRSTGPLGSSFKLRRTVKERVEAAMRKPTLDVKQAIYTVSSCLGFG